MFKPWLSDRRNHNADVDEMKKCRFENIPEEVKEAIREDARAGLSYMIIMKHHSVSKNTVIRIKKEMGLIKERPVNTANFPPQLLAEWDRVTSSIRKRSKTIDL